MKSAQETNNFCYLKRQDSISERNPTQLQYQILSKVLYNNKWNYWTEETLCTTYIVVNM